MYTNTHGRTIRFVEGDITKVAVDAIANAANSSLTGGGGVDGAIHRAGGPTLMRELAGFTCPTGSAVATTAGRLPAKWVFHAVGPIYRDGQHGEAELLASAYRTCLELADERGAKSISFPAISMGVYGYPPDQAAEIAIRTVRLHLDRPDTSVQEAVFVLFGKSAYDIFARTLDKEV
jgi:O-acetyl-ADP-ribose deacetylase (regulator of RNase III)